MMKINYIVVPGLKFKNKFGDPNWRKPEIMKVICEVFHVGMDEIMGRLRQQRIVTARQIAMAMLHRHTMMNKSDIAKMFDRDHTSVLHSLRTVKNLSYVDEDYKQQISTIEELILA